MELVLQIQTGPLAGQKIRVAPDKPVRFGRRNIADFVLPDDTHMSSLHFMIECDEKGSLLRDLASSNGTLVNGRRVAAAAAVYLAHGDLIVAGETRFLVEIVKPEPIVVPPAPQPSLESVAETPQSKLLALLRKDFQPLYAVLDAALEPDVLKVLFESKEQYLSLYEGPQGAQLTHFAPYVVRLPKESSLLEILVEKGWGKSWGIFLTCAEPLERLRKHFRQFLMVKMPDGKQAYFRFYDPRVLRVYLPTCTADETRQFFGPIKHYLMEDEKPDKLLQFANAGHGVDKKLIGLSPLALHGDQTISTTQERTTPLPHKDIAEMGQ
jgi:pSer/pThr/pTyr-binding forkhead associated (FHA) protein